MSLKIKQLTLMLLLSAAVVGCETTTLICAHNERGEKVCQAPQPTASPPSNVERVEVPRDFPVPTPLYCAAESPSSRIAAPYDVVVSADGQNIYWVGQREIEDQDHFHIVQRRYIYHLKQGQEPQRLKTASGFPLDCALGEELEIDSQGRLYVTHPFEQEIYRYDTQNNSITRVLKDTDLESHVEPPPAVYTDEAGNYKVADREYLFLGPFALFVSPNNSVFYRVFARSEVMSRTEIRQVISPTQGQNISAEHNPDALLVQINETRGRGYSGFQLGNPENFAYTHVARGPEQILYANAPEQHQIWRITNKQNQALDLSDVISAFDNATMSLHAGTGVPGLQDGPRLEAQFNQPHGLAFDAAGNLYVADTGNAAIRKITPEGIVSTLYQRP